MAAPTLAHAPPAPRVRPPGSAPWSPSPPPSPPPRCATPPPARRAAASSRLAPAGWTRRSASWTRRLSSPWGRRRWRRSGSSSATRSRSRGAPAGPPRTAAAFPLGGLLVPWLADLRGAAAASFVKFGAGLVFVTAALTFWIAAKISVSSEVDGYPLDPSYMSPARVALALVFALALSYAVLTLAKERRPGLVAGGLACARGLAAGGPR